MFGIRKPSVSLVLVAACFSALGVAAPALAQVPVSVQYETEAELEVARRVGSELASEGYTVEILASQEGSPCDTHAEKPATVPHGTKVWIRLRPSDKEPNEIVASICYLGALPFLQQARVSAPSAQPNELALAAAEAVNGLRSKLPPLASDPKRDAAAREEPSKFREPPARGDSTPEPAPNSVVMGIAAVRNLPDF